MNPTNGLCGWIPSIVTPRSELELDAPVNHNIVQAQADEGKDFEIEPATKVSAKSVSLPSVGLKPLERFVDYELMRSLHLAQPALGVRNVLVHRDYGR